MNEGFTERFVDSVKKRLFLWFTICGLAFIICAYLLVTVVSLEPVVVMAILVVVWTIISAIMAMRLGGSITKPTKYLSDAILHVSPKETLVPAPNIDELKLGREMVASLSRQVYDFAAHGGIDNGPQKSTQNDSSLDLIPLPVVGLGADGKIIVANSLANSTFQGNAGLIGASLPQAVSLQFETDDDLESWLKTTRDKSVNAQKSWTKVKATKAGGGESTYYDIAVSLTQGSASGVETMFTFFDHSEAYATEEDAMSFVALAVHELRTPLTILRGYIEAIEDELGPDINPETRAFIHKMNISAETLSGFIAKILSVARVEENQLKLHLEQDDWIVTLKNILSGLQVRALVNKKTLALEVGNNIPPVAVDKITITEVLTNLVDNAIKYSPDSAEVISIKSYVNQEGMVETTVHDDGVGIPSSVMPHLFTKFYRNHRNSNEIGGTGLGLYLSKAIVGAHNGQIWAQSEDGKGSTFGFTILPYDKLAEADKTNNNDITRQSHGWIKNHTMQRQ